jgi:hypothetical protein
MSVKRTRCLSTKLTRDEYASLERLANRQRLSAWAREILLTAAFRQATEQILLAEILALRTILVNLHFGLTRGEALSPDAFQRLIDRADHEKGPRARTLLESARRAS